MNKSSLIEAFRLAATAAVTTGSVTTIYGAATQNYSQVIPAVVFSFGTAMGVAGYYDRKALRLER